MTWILMQVFVLVALIPIWFMLRRGRYDIESASGLWSMIGFGAISIVLTFIITAPFEMIFPTLGELISSDTPPSSAPDNLLLGTAVFATIEEFAKFVPAALFLYWRPYFNQHSDGVIYFAIVGLSFGFIENMLYLAADGAITGIVRIIFGWFFHGALVAIIGYAFARKKVINGSWLPVLFSFILASALHTAYNYGLFASAWNGWLVFLSIFVTIYVNVSLFVLFYIANNQDYGKRNLVVDNGNVSSDSLQSPR